MPSETMLHVIDDDEAVRDSLAFLFDSAGLPVHAHESATAFLASPAVAGAACIVTDVRMPDMSGLELLRELRSRGANAPVVVITGHGDVPLAVEAMRAGAFDFIEKPFDDERLLEVVRRAIAAGGGENEEQAAVRARIQRLSQRERQVLKRLVEGQLNKTIAWELGISARTVEVYRAKLMAKMEAGAFADLVRMALLAGSIEDSTPDPGLRRINAGQSVRRQMADMEQFAPRFGKLLIAIVEDDRAVLNSLQFALEAQGYAVCGFERAVDALNSSEIMSADCLVLDYGLPDVDGVALLLALRRRGAASPAMIIASNPSARCRQEASLAGAPVIEKPLMGDVLVQRIHDLTALKGTD